jgi:ribulose-5-phosphate 4-epimerase/fuculose-1-phosphate aldolase
MDTVDQLKSEIISACKILSKEKLVEGFGHVSARILDSDRFLLTPRISLALVKEEDLLTLNLAGEVVAGNSSAPFESWLHVAIMKSQPRVGAITRIHARVANIFSVTDRRLEPVHNHGSFFVGGVPVLTKPDFVSRDVLGNEVSRALGDKPAILLRGNGQVTVGRRR